MIELPSFSERRIATRERLEDYATDATLVTAGGLHLKVVIVCDGSGGSDAGELAARTTARTILDYFEINTETNIPKLMVRAIEKANEQAYNELRGAGTSTLVMAVIDQADTTEYGRLYIASVGNSYIGLMRNGQLVRLNIDHTLANEYIHAGQISVEEAEKLPNANIMTRSIGINNKTYVDIGFYAEKDRALVSTHRAFKIGQKGMLLRAGDTLVLATDGILAPDAPMLTNDELLQYALSDDVEDAVHQLINLAMSRNPTDNLTLSLLFVPSSARRKIRAKAKMSARQRLVLTFISMLILGLVGLLAMQIHNTNTHLAAISATQTAVLDLQVGMRNTSTPLPTATMRPTNTPTATPTLEPTRSAANQIGMQYREDGASLPVVISRAISGASDNMVIIEGQPRLENTPTLEAANLFLQANSLIELRRMNSTPNEERLEYLLYPLADVFVHTGDFKTDGVYVQTQQNALIHFKAQSQCLVTKNIPPDPNLPNDTDKLAFTCLDDSSGICTYSLPGIEPIKIGNGQQLIVNLSNGSVIDQVDFPYEQAKTYYDTITSLTTHHTLTDCLIAFLDADGDDIPDPQDQCPHDAGTEALQGCPDSDGDDIADIYDACPDDAGVAAYGGCLTPAETPVFDLDNDGVNDLVDACPFEAGPAWNLGCPENVDAIIIQTAVAPFRGN